MSYGRREARLLVAAMGGVATIAAAPSARAGEALASPGGVDIQWEAPAACPDVNSVRLYAERLLGQPLERQAQHIVAQARVRRTEAGNWELRLSLSVGDRVEEETLLAKQCHALADVTALKVALACDPVTVVESIQLPENPAPPFAPDGRSDVPSTGHVEARADVAHPVSSGRARVAVRVTGGAGFGPLPGVTPGVGLFGSLQLRAFRAELGGQVFWGAEARYPELPEVGARLKLFSGIARGCARPGVGSVEFPVCLGFELGWMRGEGFGVETTYTAGSAWGAFVIGPAVRIPVHRLVSFWLEADAALPVLRPGFHLRNLNTLYLAPSGAARAWAGLEIDLGL